MKLAELTKFIIYASLGALGYRNYLRRRREQQEFAIRTTPEVIQAAHMLKRWLDGTGQSVVVLARRGQNLEKHSIKYSHAAYAHFDTEVQSWRIYHLLNPEAWKKSDIQVESLMEFMSDDLYSMEVAAVIPSPQVQKNLQKILKSETKRCFLHNPRYSAIAYPFSTIYQNSNGWLLENFAFAVDMSENNTRAKAQNWLKEQSYAPSIIEVDPLTVVRAKIFRENIAFDDHPLNLLQDNKVTVNTGDSVLDFISTFSTENDAVVGGEWFNRIFEIK